MLYHGYDDCVIFQPAAVFLESCAITLGAGETDSALASRRIINSLYRSFGVSGGFDHRHHHARCTGVHDALDLVRVIRC